MSTDVLYNRLGVGRDNAFPLGWYAERLGVGRRELEQAVQQLRLDGYPVCSGPDGIWLADNAVDVADTLQHLRSRMRNQYATYLALRRTLRRMRTVDVHQETLFGEAA